jgi:hypothetical protein
MALAALNNVSAGVTVAASSQLDARELVCKLLHSIGAAAIAVHSVMGCGRG